jgi:hypothetical protein
VQYSPKACLQVHAAARYAAEESRREGGSCSCCKARRRLIDQRHSVVGGYPTSKSKTASQPGVSFSEHYLLRYDIPHGKVTYGLSSANKHLDRRYCLKPRSCLLTCLPKAEPVQKSALAVLVGASRQPASLRHYPPCNNGTSAD